MNNYPPYKVFITFLLVFLLSFLFQQVFTGKLVPFGDQNLRFPEIDSLAFQTIGTRAPELSGQVVYPADEPKQTANRIWEPEMIESIDELAHPIDLQFPDNNFSYLDDFFMKLNRCRFSNEQVRIMVFGDSQIEGDRIVKDLRRSFQKSFGGNDIGLVSVYEPVYESISYTQTNSGSWKKFSLLGKKVGLNPDWFGCLLSYSSLSGDKANLTLKLRNFASDLSFRKGRIFLSQSPRKGELVVHGGVNQQVLNIQSSERCQEYYFDIGQHVNEISFDFANLGGSVFTGISFESGRGVIVDHIPLRGSSGLEFRTLERSCFDQMITELAPDLLILQYGINVVPAKASSFSYYTRLLASEIDFLQKLLPDVPVILVGVSDMGRMVHGTPKSYASVEAVNQAMLETAHRQSCVFFDLVGFMGGSGSVVQWNANNPPLIRSDLTHFSIPGGAVVAEGLFDCIMKSFQESQNRSN